MVNIGIVGAGAVVESNHLPVLHGMKEVTVKWICDIEREKARQLSRLYGVKGAYAGVEECSDVDIALVAIPVGHRRKIVEEIVRRRWHVFCEKPFAVSTRDYHFFVEAARARNVQIGIGLMRRFYDANVCAREMLRRAPFGAVQEVWASEGSRLRATGREDGWYQTDRNAAGGGVLIETGSHLIDQVFQILDVCEFEVVSCRQRMWRDLDYETTVTGAVRLNDGTECRLGVVLSRANDLFSGIEIRCANTKLVVGVVPGTPLKICDLDGQVLGRVGSPRGGPQTSYQAFYAEWREFIDQCRSGQPSRVSAESAWLTTSFIETCYRTASVVEIDRAGCGVVRGQC